ncbi:HK97 family phage prohead protease [Pararhizobium haloflavum]|uniref:HK97 family phage prohead protease n=1 Tax=Pararhizobium haloflavum TaxID=2037914 RepID=UPI001FDF012F|nr:HK97 family phage prohead protease [Pararhizobium haloflavum]
MLACRQKKYAQLALERVTGTGRFSGYASLFETVDLSRDTIAPGAFAASLKARGAQGVRMLFQHDPNEPIGRWIAIEEDERGLRVEGQLATGVARAREIGELMAAGAIDGLSIGFEAVKARSDARSGVRRILQADLWEISVVTFPMLPGARVNALKGASAMPTKREFERWLTRDAGLSRGQARAVMAKGFAGLAGVRDAAGADDPSGLAAAIRKAARAMQIEQRM